jgi:hypothetical protein
MSELVGRLAMEAGIDRSVAEETIGIAGELLRSEGLSEQIQILIDGIAGAAASSDGRFGIPMSAGLTAVGTRLPRPGLGTANFQNVAHELSSFGDEDAGAN